MAEVLLRLAVYVGEAFYEAAQLEVQTVRVRDSFCDGHFGVKGGKVGRRNLRKLVGFLDLLLDGWLKDVPADLFNGSSSACQLPRFGSFQVAWSFCFLHPVSSFFATLVHVCFCRMT
jgi:hypothetical protein